jgi:hypothetical protein
LPDDLSLKVDESDTEIQPHWAVAEPDGGWQILVRIEASRVKPEERGAIEGWEASPHQRLERLLRDKEVPIGLMITDEELRFIYAPRGETSGWMCFPLRSLGEVGGRPMLGGLKLLLSCFRLHNDAPNRRLPALLKASRDAQAEVSTKLASLVLGALHELLRDLHAADAEGSRRWRQAGRNISTTVCWLCCFGWSFCYTQKTVIWSRRAPTPPPELFMVKATESERFMLIFSMTRHITPIRWTNGEGLDVLAILAWLRRDELIAGLEKEIDAAADDPQALTDVQRAERFKTCLGNLLEAEREEEAAVLAASFHVIRRADADPRAVLGLSSALPGPKRELFHRRMIEALTRPMPTLRAASTGCTEARRSRLIETTSPHGRTPEGLLIADMRFIANGPDIPEDLLIARDKGDVIFFCGAGGVSRRIVRGSTYQLKPTSASASTALVISSTSPIIKRPLTIVPPPVGWILLSWRRPGCSRPKQAVAAPSCRASRNARTVSGLVRVTADDSDSSERRVLSTAGSRSFLGPAGCP